MKVRVILLTLTVLFASATVCLAQNAHMGTWNLNDAKSKFAPGATKNHTVVYESAGNSVKVIVDGTDAAGTAIRHEWTGKFNGKFYPVTGDPTSDMRSYRRINSRAMTITGKKDGKVTVTGRITVTANGRTRTVTTTAVGSKVSNRAVYDKQ